MRADAAMLADEIIGVLWAADHASLGTFKLNDTKSTCGVGANAAGVTEVTNWLKDVKKALPGAADYQQIIAVDTATSNVVKVTLCWKSPQDATPHTFTSVAQIPDN